MKIIIHIFAIKYVSIVMAMKNYFRLFQKKNFFDSPEQRCCIIDLHSKFLTKYMIIAFANRGWLVRTCGSFKRGIAGGKCSLLTEKSFRNLIESNWNPIVFTIFRLFWNQTAMHLVPKQSENGKFNLISVWFKSISKRFLYV